MPVRTALVLGFAVLAGLGAAAIMLAAHRSAEAATWSGVGTLAAALKLLHDLIE